MYTILINERIMHRSSNINSFRILVDKEYTCYDKNGNEEIYDMKEFQCIFEYKLPISNNYVPITLSPTDDLYKDKVQYIIPITIDLTREVGSVEIKFIFVKLDMLPDGTKIERVRPTASSTVDILPIPQWSDYIPNAELDAIAQVMLNLQSKIEQEKAYAELIHSTKADSIHIDKETNTLCLDADGKHISGIDLTDLGDTLVDVNKEGTVKVII